MVYLGCSNGMFIGFAGRASFAGEQASKQANKQATVPDLWVTHPAFRDQRFGIPCFPHVYENPAG